MIKTVTGSILYDLPSYSIILNLCNALGLIGVGLGASIAKKWPKAFDEYHDVCRWHKDGYEHELVGMFCATQVKPDLIICNCIAQDTVYKGKQVTNYNAWEKIAKKLELQTRLQNQNNHMNWSIHALEKIGCAAGGEMEKMHEIFSFFFETSPVNFYFHK